MKSRSNSFSREFKLTVRVFLFTVEMAPLYEALCTELKLTKDNNLLKTLKSANEAELKKLQDKITDAQENLGETEISDALIAKAMYLSRIGDKVRFFQLIIRNKPRLLFALPTKKLVLWVFELILSFQLFDWDSFLEIMISSLEILTRPNRKSFDYVTF
jgi:hypothetical protein